MTDSIDQDSHALVLDRLIDAPRRNVYRAWTEPNLLRIWFAPQPWEIAEAQLDVRPGGSSLIVMKGPDGTLFPNRGVYLEVVENARIVFTDAYVSAWKPSPKPFMTVELSFSDDAGRTRYVATARHWSAEDKAMHEKMGFLEGWNLCADQLEALARTL